MAKLPTFDALWNKYPHGSPEFVKQMIGGKVNAAWIVNTCTIRMSYTFNHAGLLIPRGFAGLNVVSGGDGLNYAYRVAEFRQWMVAAVGKPAVKGARSAVEGKKGVIMFDVRGWSDATGHFDLWNGGKCAHEEYFDKASQVWLWTC
jgi:hypothetical protein